MKRIDVRVDAARAAGSRGRPKTGTYATRALLVGGTDGSTGSAVGLVEAEVRALAVALVGIAWRARAHATAAIRACRADVSAAPTVRAVVRQVHAAGTIAVFMCRVRADALAIDAKLCGRARMAASPTVGGIARKIDATMAWAVVRLRRAFAATRSRLAHLARRTCAAASAAVGCVVLEIAAGGPAIERCARGARAFGEQADLVGATGVPARSAIGGVILGNGFAEALLTIVDESVALVVEAVPADLGVSIRSAPAHLGRERVRFYATPVLRRGAVDVSRAGACANAIRRIMLDAELRSAIFAAFARRPERASAMRSHASFTRGARGTREREAQCRDGREDTPERATNHGAQMQPGWSTQDAESEKMSQLAALPVQSSDHEQPFCPSHGDSLLKELQPQEAPLHLSLE
jgi:hypothetical protein